MKILSTPPLKENPTLPPIHPVHFICKCTAPLRRNRQYKFAVFYNKQIPHSLFNLYTPELKEKLTLEKTKTVPEGLHVQYGDLRSLDLIKQDSGFNSYKASFLHQNLTLLLALNDENLIEGYRLVPYPCRSCY